MTQTQPKKVALLFIFITILVDVIGIGIIIPVIPELIHNLTGKPPSEGAEWSGWLMMAFSLTQFLFAPLMGELSDRFGRKPILIIALLGLGVDYIFHALAPSIYWLIITRLFAGMCGASFTVATAYIADISTPETKAKNFGLVGAAFGMGFVIGPAIGGIFAEFGVAVPFLIAAGFSLLNCVFGLFVIPESLAPENRRKFDWRRTIPFVSMYHLKKYGPLLGLLIAFIMVNLAGQVMPSTWTFFTIEMYGWGPMMNGVSLMVVGLLVGLVQGGLTGVLTKKLGNRRVILLGFLLWTIGMVSFSLATTEIILFAALLPYVLGGIAGPTVQGVMSNRVPLDEQGNLQGVMTGMISLTAIAAPLLYTGLFSAFTAPDADVYFPGIAFAMASVFVIIASIIAVVSIRKLGNIDVKYPVKVNEDEEILDI